MDYALGTLRCSQDILQDVQRVLCESDYVDKHKYEARILLQQLFSELNNSEENSIFILHSQFDPLTEDSINVVLNSGIMQESKGEITKLKCKYCTNNVDYKCSNEKKILFCNSCNESYKLTGKDLKLYEISLKTIGHCMLLKDLLNYERENFYSKDYVHYQN